MQLPRVGGGISFFKFSYLRDRKAKLNTPNTGCKVFEGNTKTGVTLKGGLDSWGVHVDEINWFLCGWNMEGWSKKIQ